MYKLGILSRDWHEYKDSITAALPANVELLFANDNLSGIVAAEQANILLADPGLLAPNLNRFDKLQWVQSTWAGVSPLVQAGRSDYCLTGLKAVFGEKMREYVFAYLLYFARNIEAFRLAQEQRQWQPDPIGYLNGKSIGIMGVGSIGAEVAATAKHFAMQVRGLTRSKQDCAHVDQYFDMHNKSDFCRDLDFVVNLLPDTPETKCFIDSEFLSLLPSHCVLINAGRGQAIDDDTLFETLSKRQIRAAVLDVFRQEPLPENHPFWQLDNLIITQHTAAISDVKDISQIFLDNLVNFQSDKKLTNIVDWQKGY